MPLQLQCACGKKLSVRDELAGKKVKCPGCAKILVAPTPAEEVVDAEVAVGEPPVAPKKPKAKESGITKNVEPTPSWAGKKKPKKDEDDEEEEDDDTKAKDDDDDDDDEDKPGPHWTFPGTLSTEVMALAREGIWFNSLKADALKKAVTMLKNGNQPAQVLGTGGYYIPWLSVTSIWCNRKLNGFTITYTNEGESTSKVMTPKDRDERDDIIQAIEDFLAPDVERKVVKHTAITATFSPILAMVITFAIFMGLAIFSLFDMEWDGRGRGALVAAIFNFIAWLGPLGNCGIGTVFLGFMLIWMVVRMMNPPIEVTIKPAPSKPKVEDDED